jgi:hypothetical protein
MQAAGKLGELRGTNIDSNDITDKYYDLKAHLKNDQVEEEGLRKLLLEKSATGKLEDILAVRRELRTVRGEIDKQQGQLLRWDNETALATVILTIHARKDYVPPASPGFWASVSRTFGDSLEALQSAGRWLFLAVVAVLPWLLLVVIVVLLGWRLRRLKTKARVG